jgi:hypothetical protein
VGGLDGEVDAALVGGQGVGVPVEGGVASTA